MTLAINKKIAEAKGCIVLTRPDGSIYEGGDGTVRKYKNAHFPNWAENISDAWELFEEMLFPDILKIDSSYYECCFSREKFIKNIVI